MKKISKLSALLLVAALFTALLPMAVFAGATPVASVNGVSYDTLQDAIDGATGPTTITLTDSITLGDDVTITIDADKDITLDLNGKTLTGHATQTAPATSFEMIKVEGKLTICDTAGGGVITFKSDHPGDPNDANKNYCSDVITNCGDLTILGGTIENACESGSAVYVVDNYAGSSCTISGGTLTSRATVIRVTNSSNDEADKVELLIEGGVVESTDGYCLMTQIGGNAFADIEITGGEFSSGDSCDTDVEFWADASASAVNVDVNISGGTFPDWVIFNAAFADTMKEEQVDISGGSFYCVYSWGVTALGPDIISGGTHTYIYNQFVENGYLGAVPANGSDTSFTVMPQEQVQAVVCHDPNGDESYEVFYESLADAFAAACEEDVVAINPELPEGTVIEIPEGKTAYVGSTQGEQLGAGKYKVSYPDGDDMPVFNKVVDPEPTPTPNPGRPNPSTGVKLAGAVR